jgi:hypothetical protein
MSPDDRKRSTKAALAGIGGVLRRLAKRPHMSRYLKICWNSLRVQKALACSLPSLKHINYVAHFPKAFRDPRCHRPRSTAAGSFPCSSGVGSRSSTSPDTISVTRFAHRFRSRRRLGCSSAMPISGSLFSRLPAIDSQVPVGMRRVGSACARLQSRPLLFPSVRQ